MSSIPIFSYGEAEEQQQQSGVAIAPVRAGSTSGQTQTFAGSLPAQSSSTTQSAAGDNAPTTDQHHAAESSAQSLQLSSRTRSTSTSNTAAASKPRPQATGVGSKQPGPLGAGRKAAASKGRIKARGRDQHTSKDDVDAAQEELDDLGYVVTPEVVMEVKRRKVAFRAMMKLLEEGAANQAELARIAAPMSGDELHQVSEERSLAGKCGNPLCSSTMDAQRAQRTRWLARDDTIEGESGALYCCQACRALVQQYAQVLGDPLQRMKPEAKEQLLVSHKPKGGQPAVAAQVGGVTTMLAEIQEHTSTSLPKAPVLGPGASGAVEGYVPRSMQASHQTVSAQADTNQQSVSGQAVTNQLQHELGKAHDEPQAALQQEQAATQTFAQQLLTSSGHATTSLESPSAGSHSSTAGQQPAAAAVQQPGTGAHAAGAIEGPLVPTSRANLQVNRLQVPTNSSEAQPTDAVQPTSGELDAAPPRQQPVAVGAADERMAAAVARNIQSFVCDISAPQSPSPSPSSGGARGGHAGRAVQLQDAGVEPDTDHASVLHSGSHIYSAPGSRPSSSNGAVVKSILKRNSSSYESHVSGPGSVGDGAESGRKKRVSWADESQQEFTDRAAPAPEVPVLVFTVDGEGSNIEGSLSQLVDQSKGDVQVKQLAGRLEIGDLSKLQAITEHQLALTQQVPGADGTALEQEGRGSQALPAGSSEGANNEDVAATAGGKLPKAVRLMFPPAAGGLSWAQKRRSQATAPMGSHGTADSMEPRSTRRFAPTVPSRQAPKNNSHTAVGDHDGRAGTALLASGRSETPKVGAVAEAEAVICQSKRATAATMRTPAGGQGRQSDMLMKGAAALLQPRRPKVQLLDHPPDKQLGTNPVLDRLGKVKQPALQQQQQQDLKASNGQPKQAGSQGSTTLHARSATQQPKLAPHLRPSPASVPSYPSVVPAAERLPFEGQDAATATGSATASTGGSASQSNGIWVCKSDKEHAAPLNVRKAPVLISSGDSGDEEGSEQESWGSDGEVRNIKQRAAASGRTAARKLVSTVTEERYSSDDDGDSDASPDVSDHGSEDDDSNESEQEGVTPRFQHKRRSVRTDVIYEDEEYVPAQDDDDDDDDDDASSDEGSAADTSGDEAVNAVLPFFGAPPKEYRVELSPFNLLWSLLSSWISRETLQYVNAPASAALPQHSNAGVQGDDASASGVYVIGGQRGGVKKAVGQAGLGRDDSQEAEQLLLSLPSPNARDAQARAAMMGLLEPHVAALMRELRCPVPVSEVLKRLTGLLRTLIFPGPLPSLGDGQWRLLALAMLRALAMARLPALEGAFGGSDGSPTLRDVLQGTTFELYHLSALVDLLVNA